MKFTSIKQCNYDTITTQSHVIQPEVLQELVKTFLADEYDYKTGF